MKKVKRASRAANLIDAEGSARSRQQTLLEEYLDLQKEFVSKKKRLKIAKEKREILLAEVGFLRQKHKSFSIGAEALERGKDVVPQNSYARSKLPRGSRNYSVKGSQRKSPSPVAVFNPVLGNEKQNFRQKEEAVLNSLKVEKKPKNCLINKKRDGKKKKTSWQDQMEALKV